MRAATAFCLAGLLGFAGPLTAQDQISLSPTEMRQAALMAMEAGARADARIIAEALLERDPGDLLALSVLARLAIDAGDAPAARAAALGIWRGSDDPVQRYQAARLIALAHAEAGQFTRAQLWLRRALTQAPDAAEARRTAEDFRAVRDQNPLSVELSFSASPSDNVNGGSTTDVIRVDGGFDATFGLPLTPGTLDQAYSGLGVSAGVNLSWRLPPTQTRQTQLWLIAQARGVILSDESRDALADEKDRDGDPITGRHFSSAQLLVGQDSQFAAANGAWSLGAHLGRSFARGDPSDDILSLSLGRSLVLAPGESLSFGYGREWRRDSGADSIDQIRDSLRLGYTVAAPDFGRLRYSLQLTDARSDSYSRDFDRLSASVSYRPARPVAGVAIEGSLSASWTNYPDYRYFSARPVEGGRTDRQFGAALSATFEEISYAGFSPVISLDAQRTLSNFNQFESGGLSVNFGIESSF